MKVNLTCQGPFPSRKLERNSGAVLWRISTLLFLFNNCTTTERTRWQDPTQGAQPRQRTGGQCCTAKQQLEVIPKEASMRCIPCFSGRPTLNKSYSSSKSSGRMETSGMTTRSLKRRKIMLVTSVTQTDSQAVLRWNSWKPQLKKILCCFPPSLGSPVGEIHEKRNPSRAIRNKDRKSLSYRSQRPGMHCMMLSLLTLFPMHLLRTGHSHR